MPINSAARFIYADRGDTYALMKKYDLALADYDRSIAEYPGNVLVYLSKASVLETLGRTQAAIATYQKYLENADPANSDEIALVKEHLVKLGG